MKINSILKTSFLSLFFFFGMCLHKTAAQVKMGDNPTTINAGSVLELESTNKALMLPRIALTATTTWGLAGTAMAGMTCYNTNAAITSSNTLYPANGTGEYYWDGTGWVSKKSPATAKFNNLVFSQADTATGLYAALYCSTAFNYRTWTSVPGLSQTFTLPTATTVDMYTEIFLGQEDYSGNYAFAQGFMILQIDGVNDPATATYAPMYHETGNGAYNWANLMNKSFIDYKITLAAGTHTVKTRYFLSALSGTSLTTVSVCPFVDNWLGGANMANAEMVKSAAGRLRISY